MPGNIFRKPVILIQKMKTGVFPILHHGSILMESVSHPIMILKKNFQAILFPILFQLLLQMKNW